MTGRTRIRSWLGRVAAWFRGELPRLVGGVCLSGAVVGCAVSESPPESGQARRNDVNRFNVLFIAVDDLRPELGCYGAEYVETPNIDALARRGVTFGRHYATVPTCGASRYALLTGRSPEASNVRGGNDAFHRGAARLDPSTGIEAQSLPERFRRSGYRTVAIGKLSHTPDGRVFAYDGSGDGRQEVPHAWDELATPYGPWQRGWGCFFAYAEGEHREGGTGAQDLSQFVVQSDDDLPDGMMARRAVRELAELADSDQPFFLGVGFYKPHLPFVAPARDFDAVGRWPVPPPDHARPFDSRYWHRSGEFYRYDMAWPKERPLAPTATDAARRAYLACVRYTDRQVGRVLRGLEAAGLADSTVVVLWSDHGWYLGEGALWGKHTLLERALHCPLIMRVPGLEDVGRRSDALVSSLDIYPTLVDLCRPSYDRTRFPLDGTSLVPVLTGQLDSVREFVRGYWRGAVTVRSDEHRLVMRRGVDGWRDHELYSFDEGADSTTDRASEYPAIVSQLEAFAGKDTR